MDATPGKHMNVEVMPNDYEAFIKAYPLGIRTTIAEQRVLNYLYEMTNGFRDGIFTQLVTLSDSSKVAVNVVAKAISLIASAGIAKVVQNARGSVLLPQKPDSEFVYEGQMVHSYTVLIDSTKGLEYKSVRKVEHFAETSVSEKSRQDYACQVERLLGSNSILVIDASHIAILMSFTPTQTHYWLHSVGRFTNFHVYNLRHKVVLSRDPIEPGDKTVRAALYQVLESEPAHRCSLREYSFDSFFIRTSKLEYAVFLKLMEITNAGHTAVLFKQAHLAKYLDVGLPMVQKAVRAQALLNLPFSVDSNRSGSMVCPCKDGEGFVLRDNEMNSIPAYVISYGELEAVEPLSGSEYLTIPQETIQAVREGLLTLLLQHPLIAVSIIDLRKIFNLTDYKMRYILKKLCVGNDICLYRVCGHLVVSRSKIHIHGLSELGRLYQLI